MLKLGFADINGVNAVKIDMGIKTHNKIKNRILCR